MKIVGKSIRRDIMQDDSIKTFIDSLEHNEEGIKLYAKLLATFYCELIVNGVPESGAISIAPTFLEVIAYSANTEKN